MSKSYIQSLIFVVGFAILVIVWGYYWSQFGLDLTDEGVSLYCQMKVLKNSYTGVSPAFFWIGSDLVGSLWLSIFDNNSLHFAKWGAFIYFGLILLINYFSIYKISNNIGFSIVIILLSYIIFCSINIFPIINYDLVPLLPISLFLYLYQLNKVKSFYFNYFIFGFLLTSLFISRVTLLPIIIFGSILVFLNGNLKFKLLFEFILGGVVLLTIFLFSPFTSKISLLFFDTLYQSFYAYILGGNKNPSLSLFSSNNYSLMDQLNFWIRGYFRIFFIAFVLVLFGNIILKYFNSKFRFFLVILFLIFICCFIMYPNDGVFVSSIDLEVFQIQFFYNYVLSAILFLSFILLYLLDKNNRGLIVFLFLIFVSYPLGSNSYEKKLATTYPIVVPYLFTLLYFLNNSVKQNQYYILFVNYFKLCIIPLLLTVIVKAGSSPYRDSSISKLKFESSFGSLIGIRTTELKVKSITPLLNWLQLNSNTNTKLLVLGKANMINYLSNLDGPFDYPYPSYLDFHFIENEIYKFNHGNSMPDLIIYPIVDISNEIWIKDSTKYFGNSHFDKFVIKFIKGNYNLVFDNGIFRIYAKK